MMLRQIKLHGQNGFTILEMMIAASVFSVILLIAAAGVLSFTNAYYKGVTSTTTQQAARAVLDDVAQNVQVSGSGMSFGGGSGKWLCLKGSLQYAYQLGRPVTKSVTAHSLVKDSDSTCANSAILDSAFTSAEQREMLGEHMRLAVFDVQPVPSTSAFTIHVRVIYGDSDLLTVGGSDLPSGVDANPAWWANSANGPNVSCKSGIGSQFCAVSDLTTTVQARM